VEDRRIVEPGSQPAVTLPYLSLEHIESNRGRILRNPAEGFEGAGASTTFAFDGRHILYGKLRPYLNKVALPDFEGRCTTELVPLLPRAGAKREFVAWLLRRPETVGAAMREKTGSRMPRANMGELLRLEVPLPPLGEQMRITAILERQMALIERARATAKAQWHAVQSLLSNDLREIFEGARAKEWPKVRLGDLLVEPLRTGISKPLRADSTHSCLTLSSVRNGTLDLSVKKPVDVSKEEAESNRVRPGAFYVVRGNGNRSLVGRGAQAPPVIESPVVYPDLLFQVIVDLNRIRSNFLRFAWDCNEIRADIESRARTSAGIFKINQSNLAEVKIPLPSLDEQEQVAATLAERRAVIGRAAQGLEEGIEAINALPVALLRRAFAGEL
jgi:type I restriction enzyme S subunit